MTFGPGSEVLFPASIAGSPEALELFLELGIRDFVVHDDAEGAAISPHWVNAAPLQQERFAALSRRSGGVAGQASP
jgi:hypothetical protein